LLNRHGKCIPSRKEETMSNDDRAAPSGSGARGEPRSAAPQREDFRSDQVEALLTAELERLRQKASEYLRGDADELKAEVMGVRRLVSEYLPGDADKLMGEVDALEEKFSQYLREDAERLTAEVDKLKQVVSDCLYGARSEEG
jgi:hypothetical protein